MSTIAEETAAMRAKSGVRTITHEELQALANTTPTAPRAASSSATQARARATATGVSRTSEDVYANPPDPYARALDAGRQPAPTPPADPLDGYALALAKRKQEEEETHVHE